MRNAANGARWWISWIALAGATPCQDAPQPVYDDAWLRGVVAELVPAVERECGRRFRTPPRVGIADAGDVLRALRDDLAPSLGQYFAGQPRARIDKAIRMRSDLLATSMLGKYGFASKEVYVLPHLARFQLAVVNHAAVPLGDLMKLVVAHELVHALQDQELDLAARVAAATDADATDAVGMLIEGHAVFCSERVAAANGFSSVVEPLRALFVGAHDSTTVPAANLTTRRARGYGTVVYLRSAASLAREHAAGGHERLWQLLSARGTRARELLCTDPGPTVADLSAHFADLDTALGGRAWTTGRSVLSERLLLGENLPRSTDVLALLPAIRGSGEWFSMSPTPNAWRAVYLLSFAEPDAAAAFVAIAGDVAAQDGGGLGEQFVRDDAPAVDGAPGTRWRQSITGAKADLVLWRRGRHVVQATIVNSPVQDGALAAAIGAVFARLDD